MFNSEFFPTPQAVIQEMIEGETLTGKNVLEPSAGKGDLVDALLLANANVIACETHPELRLIVASKCRVLKPDFFEVKSEEVSHIDFIVMNPPFSNADKHILHAYDIAPAGCRIIALCNSDTIRNPYTKTRQELEEIISAHGNVMELGAVFDNSERTTDVEVSLVRLQKPGTQQDEFTGFFTEEEEKEEQSYGIMPYNVVRDLVNRYVESIRIFDEQLETAIRLNELQDGYFNEESSEDPLSISVSRLGAPVHRNQFKKQMQKAGWRFIFDKLDMQKYATKGLREDINKFVEKQSDVPFTMRNIYRMLDVIIGTNGSRMDRACLEVFDKVTKHYDENRYGVEGWKTNSQYLLCRRFILPHVASMGFRGNIWPNSNGWAEPLEDMQKALTYLTGKQVEHPTMWAFLHDNNKPFGEWFEWGFFRMKCFKKGTAHIEFLSEEVWASFNQRIAKIKGYPLPEKQVEKTAYQKRQTHHKQTQGMAFSQPVN